MSEPSKLQPGLISIRVAGRLVWHRDEGRLPLGEVERRTSEALRAAGLGGNGQRQDYAGPPDPTRGDG